MNEKRAPSLAGNVAVAMLLAGLTLPATAAGLSEGQGLESDLGGKRFVGVVRNVYVQVANKVLLDATHAPGTAITRDMVHFADVEFAQRLPNGAEAMLAQLADLPEVQVGDIVELRIAHKDNPRFFPVKEVTRVTGLVAKSDTALARNFTRGITLARCGDSSPQAMSQIDPDLSIASK